MIEATHIGGGWLGAWQVELRDILDMYRDYRRRRPLFFLYLFVFFFLVNAVFYWIALAASFPELIVSQTGRMLLIQQAVAILGGLFDSLSFFLTVYLVGRAARTRYGLNFAGILSIDLVIAAVATAWVLLVVMLASWAIGPPEETAMRPAQQVVATEVSVSNEPEPQQAVQEDTGGSAVSATPVVDAARVDLSPGPAQPSAREAATDSAQQESTTEAEDGINSNFYRSLLVRALQNPFANYRYFLFGILMGLSTLLPTMFHIYMGARSYSLVRAQQS